ncbi:MAG: MBL fold metallo-hydrolase [Ignavibacteriales bacterium]|nr:MBL fold metallo-hydrolase [Ignavibacteriales bacterium]
MERLKPIRFILLFCIVCFATISSFCQLTQDSTIVVLLGTGMPRPSPQAQGPATAVVVGARVFVFDAGPGVERQLAAAELPINGVTALFITHLHSDHTLGYPDLLFTSWVMGRKEPLSVFGPPGLSSMTMHLYAAYAEDIKVRVEGLEHQTPDAYRADVHEIKPGVVYEVDGVKVTAFAVPHGNWKHAFGYRNDTRTRSIVISGDTKPSAELEKAAMRADVLVHEVYPEARLAPENRPGGEDWPKYMREFHTSDKELGRIASRAQPKLLVLHHVVRMGGMDEEMISAIKAAGFQGRVVVGKDLERY